MADQVLPLENLTELGVVKDTPSVGLPPNVFSDVQNVRFDDTAVVKFPGEEALTIMANLANTDIIQHIGYWPRPNEGDVYVIVTNSGSNVYGVWLSDRTTVLGTITVTGTPRWQHTLFNGGYHFILNSGQGAPVFLQEDIASVTELPNWGSYTSQEEVISVEYSTQFANLSLGRNLAATGNALDSETVRVTIIPRDASISITTATTAMFGGVNPIGTSEFTLNASNPSANQEFSFINFASTAVAIGDTIRVSIVTESPTNVTAKVIRGYNNLLVAGGLRELDGAGNNLRSLTGVIRTSDVAAPGSIPANWDPFRNGANTADEFPLASTGSVQDLVELQGVLYVYTDSSIHSIQQTGNAQLPFQITPVTDAYGASNTDSVLEVDGKHIVVGSNDVYIFAGHPGSIQSIADGRVRKESFFEGDVRILRFNKHDEIWFWEPNDSLQYVWNYRDNTWTIRSQTTPVAATAGPEIVFATGDQLYTVDGSLTDLSGSPVNAWFERKRLAVTPEFDTETLNSIAIVASGNASLGIAVEGTNTPGEEIASFASSEKVFDIQDDYKQDIRVNGRLLNYRVSGTAAEDFAITNMQFSIMKGGRR